MKVGVACSHIARTLFLSPRISALVAVNLILMVSASVAVAQATTSRKVDYGPAVEEFIKQGFPNIAGARYVKVEDRNFRWNYDGFRFDQVEAMNKLTGNGFYIPNKDSSKPGKFIFLGGCELAYVKKGKRVPADIHYQALTQGEIKEADLKKDLGIVQKWAATASTANNFEYYGTENFAVAFGYANLVYQMGYKNEANELFKTLFLNHDDPEKFIDHLINSLAEREYGEIYSTFNKEGNWQKYHAELVRLQAKYPRGWKNQPGLELLIPQVKDRMNNVALAAPSIAGHTFSPEIQKIIEATANPPKSRNNYYARESLFLINKVNKNTKAPPFYQLTQYGMDGFIALVALIGDKSLVVQSNNHGGYSSRTTYYHGDEEIKSPERAYQSLNKPSSRGAIAEAIVRSTLPHDYSTIGEMESEQLKRFAMDWWKTHQNDSKMELTKHYLELGNQSHAHNLATTLMKQDTEESRELLEKSILSSQRPSNFAEIVKTYVKKRRAKAKDFISKYKKTLIAEIGDGIEGGQYSIREAGGTDKFIASLMRYTTGLKPSQMLNKLSRKDAKVAEIMEMLVVAYKGKDVSKELNKFIYAAAKKKNVSEQSMILTGLQEIMYDEPEGAAHGAMSGAVIGAVLEGIPDGADGGALTREKLMELMAASGEDVIPIPALGEKKKKQIQKPREISFSKYEREDWETLLFSDNSNVASLTGMILDKYVNPSRMYGDYDECESLGRERLFKLIKARSRSLLNGEKLEPLPNISQVSEARQKEVLEIVKSAKPSELRKTLLSLSLSEQIVVIESENYHAKFSEAALFVSGFASQNSAYKVKEIEKLQGYLASLIGLKIEAETYDKSAKILLENLEQFGGLSLSLNSFSELPGSDIVIFNLARVSGDKQKKAIADVMSGKIEGFVSLSSYGNDGKTENSLIYSDGKFPSKQELQKLATAPNLGLTVFTKASIQKQRKERAANADERKKIIEALIKLNPSLEQHKERFEEFNLEMLQQYLKQYQQMMGQ